MQINLPNCQDCPNKGNCNPVYLNNDVYCPQGVNGEPFKTTASFEVYRNMIPNGKEMEWKGHHLVFESEEDWCRGCFFADKDSCPDCDEGAWVEQKHSLWHTGTPTEDGLYVIAYRNCYGNTEDISYATAIVRGSVFFYFQECRFGRQVMAWQKIEPFEEKDE